MASKTSKINNPEAVKPLDAMDITNLVLESMALTRVDAKLDWLKDRQKSLESQKNEIRSRLVKVMQTLSHHPWDSLKGPIKAALIGAGCKNVDGALGVYKTSFKERVLPVGENADRFRKKMEFWIGWNGQKVRNPEFKKVEPKAAANSTTPTASTPTASTPTASTPTASTPAATPTASTPAATKATPTASTATPTASTTPTATKAATASTPTASTASTPTASTPTASTTPTAPTRVNINSSDNLTTLEHWQTIHTQWMNNRLHMYFVQELSGVLGIEPDKLQMALNEAGKALVNRANKVNK